MAGAKKKPVKMSWQEAQAAFGTQSRAPLDNLPTSSRGYEQGRDFRSGPLYAERERRERREDQDEGPSRAEESSLWRSAGPPVTSGGGSSMRSGGGFDDRSRDRDRGDIGRSDDGAWRPSRQPSTSAGMSSSFGAGGARREASTLERRRDDTESIGRPRLNLQKPSQERIQAANEETERARAAMKPAAVVAGDTKPMPSRPTLSADAKAPSRAQNPFGDAKPVVSSNVPENAPRPTISLSRPLGTTTAPLSDRFSRPVPEEAPLVSRSRATPQPEASNRFARHHDSELPVHRVRTPENVVQITPSRPPKRTVVAPVQAPAPIDQTLPQRTKPSKPQIPSKPESNMPVETALGTAMSEGTWVSADELADSIAAVSLQSDGDLDALAKVLSLSLKEKTLLLPSALSLLPKEKLPVVLQHTLRYLISEVPVDMLESIVDGVNVVAHLGIDTGLPRDQIIAQLTDMGLGLLAPKEDVAAQLKSMCQEATTTSADVMALIQEKYPTKGRIPGEVTAVVGEFVVAASLTPKGFNESVIESNSDLLKLVCGSTKSQMQLLFGAQAAWVAHGLGVKRSGRMIFEALYELRLVSVDALVGWMHDKEHADGKRQLLLQSGGFISDLQDSAIGHANAASDSEDSVDLDNDFPQANRNYEDY